MTWLVNIEKSTNKDKRLKAEFCLCKKYDECKGKNRKIVHFGLKDGKTFIDHKDEEKRKNYIARHSKSPGEDWSNPMTAGALSRFILWEKPNLKEAIKAFKKKFSL